MVNNIMNNYNDKNNTNPQQHNTNPRQQHNTNPQQQHNTHNTKKNTTPTTTTHNQQTTQQQHQQQQHNNNTTPTVGTTVMKNCDPLVLGPALAMLRVKGWSCLREGWISSSNSPPHIDSPANNNNNILYSIHASLLHQHDFMI